MFWRRLARDLGHDLGWEVVTGERMVSVSVAATRGDLRPVARLFTEISDPVRVAALRKALDFIKRDGGVTWNDIYIATTVAGQEYRGVLVGRAGPDFLMRGRAREAEWLAVGSTSDLHPDKTSGDEVILVPRTWP